MRKTLISLLLTFQAAYSVEPSVKDHNKILVSHYPYGLLTNDFGVLNEDDLKINTCIATPSPFSEKNPYSAYSYWQCFGVKTAKLICEGNQYDPDQKTRVSWLVVSAALNGEVHEYMARRGIPSRSCHLYQQTWQKITKKEKYLCVSGSMWSHKKDKSGKKNWTWIFDRYKTKKGCDSYFDGECDIKNSIDHGRCEN